jgi:hypothetical protein
MMVWMMMDDVFKNNTGPGMFQNYGHVTRYTRKSDFARQSSVDNADFPKRHVDSTSNDDTIATTTSTFIILIVNYRKLQHG